MTVIIARRFVFGFLRITARTTVMAFAASRFSSVLGIAHTAAATLNGRHEQQQCKYEYQEFHPFTFNKFNSAQYTETGDHHKGSIQQCQ